jgi:hypothetical protein
MDRDKNLSTADGMTIFASTNDESRQNLFSMPISYQPSAKLNIVFTKCGHLGPKKAVLNFWGNIRDFKIKNSVWDNIKSIGGLKTIRYHEVPCPECIFNSMREQAIRCALCGTGIIPGEGVALYHLSNPIPHLELATRVGESVIGCLGWNCCPSGAFFAGHWTEEGFRSAFKSGNCLATEVLVTGKPHFASNKK